jgi:hypothetical protein
MTKFFKCYYCEGFETDIDRTYQNHVEQNHPSKSPYPTLKQIQELGLQKQGKVWEEMGIE